MKVAAEWLISYIYIYIVRTDKFSYNILQFTDEEIEQSYEEFYEDVHTEFLKFGELVNFKVLFSSFPADHLILICYG
jgi:hypothetical protein